MKSAKELVTQASSRVKTVSDTRSKGDVERCEDACVSLDLYRHPN